MDTTCGIFCSLEDHRRERCLFIFTRVVMNVTIPLIVEQYVEREVVAAAKEFFIVGLRSGGSLENSGPKTSTYGLVTCHQDD